jgi:arginyl-tRNA synthetase
MNRFYYEHRIISDNRQETAARLLAADCARTVIKTGLGLIGVGAPERM